MHTLIMRLAHGILRDIVGIRHEQAHAKFALPDFWQKGFV